MKRLITIADVSDPNVDLEEVARKLNEAIEAARARSEADDQNEPGTPPWA